MAPLCHVGVPPPPRATASDVGMLWPVLFAYIDALPFPGRAAGRRFTITDEDRGIICESSLNSSKEMSASLGNTNNAYLVWM
jgi:hypothetical protein